MKKKINNSPTALEICKWKLWNRIINTVRQEKGLPLRADKFKEYNERGVRNV